MCLGNVERAYQIVCVGEVGDVGGEVRLLSAGDAEASVLVLVCRVLPEFAVLRAGVCVIVGRAEPADDDVSVIEVKLLGPDSEGDADATGLASRGLGWKRAGFTTRCAHHVVALPSGRQQEDACLSGLGPCSASPVFRTCCPVTGRPLWSRRRGPSSPRSPARRGRVAEERRVVVTRCRTGLDE